MHPLAARRVVDPPLALPAVRSLPFSLTSCRRVCVRLRLMTAGSPVLTVVVVRPSSNSLLLHLVLRLAPLLFDPPPARRRLLTSILPTRGSWLVCWWWRRRTAGRRRRCSSRRRRYCSRRSTAASKMRSCTIFALAAVRRHLRLLLPIVTAASLISNGWCSNCSFLPLLCWCLRRRFLPRTSPRSTAGSFVRIPTS